MLAPHPSEPVQAEHGKDIENDKNTQVPRIIPRMLARHLQHLPEKRVRVGQRAVFAAARRRHRVYDRSEVLVRKRLEVLIAGCTTARSRYT